MKKADQNKLSRISNPLDFRLKEKQVEGEESVEFQIARDKSRSFDPKRWAQALEQKRQMSRPGKIDHDPGIAAFRKLDPKLGAIFLPEKSTKADLVKVKNPSPKGSFGFAGNAFEIKGKAKHLPGTLVIGLDEKIANRVGLETVRLFRWNSREKRFDKLERSGVSFQREYVWGRITQPGIYVAIGFPSHPLVAHAARLFCAGGEVMRAASLTLRDRIRDRICQVILCAPDISEALQNSQFVRDLEELGDAHGFPTPPSDWPSGGGGNLCDLCLGAPALTLPECELIPVPGGLGCSDSGWTSVGPSNVGGCAFQVAVDPNEPNRIFAASADGGIWRLDDVSRYPSRSAWVPLTDQEDTLGTRALAIAQFDSRIIYYADDLGRLMRSDDRGAHWRSTATGLGNIRRILVHPSDPDTVFIASSAGFKGSADGGVHWDPLLDGDALDAAMDVDDSSVLFVGIRNEGLYKSYTSGSAWRLMLDWAQATAPGNTMIKIALGSQGTEARRTVAVRFADEVITNQRGGRPPGVTGGGPWTSRGNVGFSQGDWDHVIAIDPFNDNVILSGGTQLFRTSDGGVTPWTLVIDYYGPHEDQQGLAFDPVNPNIVYVANDGGVYRSSDDGVTWIVTTPAYDQTREIREKRDLNRGLITAQFYRVGVSGNRAVGNLYHSGIIGTNVLSTSVWEGIEGHAWEFASVYGDPKRTGTFYVFGGNEVFRRLYPPPVGGAPVLHRITPAAPPDAQIPPACIAVDETIGSGILLVGTRNPGRVMRTANADFMTFAGGELAPAMAWAAENGINLPGETITAIECAPSLLRKAYAASSTGRIFTKEDISTAAAWQERNNCGIGGVRELAVSAGNVDRLYAINGDTVRFSDDGGLVWHTRNGTGIDTLPNSEFNSIVTHPNDPETVFLGADIGIFISTDEGQHWQPFDVGLPNAQLLQIYWRNGWLYAVTYGRGLWRRQPCL